MPSQTSLVPEVPSVEQDPLPQLIPMAAGAHEAPLTKQALVVQALEGQAVAQQSPPTQWLFKHPASPEQAWPSTARQTPLAQVNPVRQGLVPLHGLAHAPWVAEQE